MHEFIPNDFFDSSIDYRFSELGIWNDHPYSEEIKNFAKKRQIEFLSARKLLQELLRQYDLSDFKLLNSEDRAPIWPDGFVGSISHSGHYVIVLLSQDHRALGVDIEAIMSLDRANKLRDQFVSEEEMNLCQMDTNIFTTLVFSAKESLFKLVYPLCKKYFGFKVATLMNYSSHTFQIKLHTTDSEISAYNGVYTGKWIQFDGYLMTFLSLSK
jgi:enterobactin synthetase component D